MTLQPLSWTDADWQASVHDWLATQLSTLDVQLTAPIEQPHVQWWATTMRVPTNAGPLWFKASQPELAFEGALLELLASTCPQLVTAPLAVDRDAGWILMPDAGTRLREAAPGHAQLPEWERLLPDYAQLQLDVASRDHQLRELGVPHLGLDVLPELLRQLAEDKQTLLEAPEEALDAEEYAQLIANLARFDRECDDLAALGVPLTLQHDDLHDANVFVSDQGQTIIDWGDACLSHPFHTLVVTLRALAYRCELAAGAPELLRLRDAYLEPFAAYGSRADLVEAADIARRTGTVARALAWHRYVTAMPAEQAADDVGSVPYGIHLYLHNGAFGTWS